MFCQCSTWGCFFGRIKQWDSVSGHPRGTVACGSALILVCVVPGGRCFLVFVDWFVVLWEVSGIGWGLMDCGGGKSAALPTIRKQTHPQGATTLLQANELDDPPLLGVLPPLLFLVNTGRNRGSGVGLPVQKGKARGVSALLSWGLIAKAPVSRLGRGGTEARRCLPCPFGPL